ncbi:MAG TPA: SpoIID/LytB domain-containing protein [Gaiellaceae bacterium]|nr:SpoIID/LytB domain-containing protein [Gaiellaceae bacterium]
MRRALLISALLSAVLVLAPSASARALFVLDGRGWGHAVGMSQWGAFGMAKGGSSYREILGHYYTDVSLFTRPSSPTVRVELAAGRTSLLVGSSGSFRVSAGTRTATHKPGSATVTKTSTGRIKVQGISGSFKSPATFTATSSSAPLRLGSSHYRGSFVVSVAAGALRLVNRLDMELYLRGVVPRESPAWWPQAALRAQAVAARSYALYSLVRGPGKCNGAFCPDTRDQVYGGLDGEEPSTNEAVAATARQVILDKAGEVAQAFFHSSSGGRTADSVDIWGGRVSYLKSVADPLDLVRENPNRSWRVLRTPAQLRSQLGLPRTPNDATVTRDSSDRVGSIRASGPGWATIVDGGDSLRWRMGLKSNRFWLGVLRLTRSDGRIEWGARSTLSAFTRGVRNALLQRRVSGGTWQDMTTVDGSQSLRVAPRRTTSYRLGRPAFGITVTVRVEPKLRITMVRARSLSGTMRPRLAGTTVSVQKLASGAWRTVGSGTVNADGAWTAAFRVRPGSYRAVAAPGQGLVPGTSPTLKVGA